MILLRLIGVLIDVVLLPLRLLARRRVVRSGAWLHVTIDGRVVDFVGKPRFWQVRAQRSFSLHSLSELVSTLQGDARVRGLLVTIRSMQGGMGTGDGARRDEDGYFWVVGRIDDVLNVAGHRIGTAEIESALVSHPAVAEAAAVGKPDDLKGQALVVFVTLKSGHADDKDLKGKLTEHIDKEIGKFARPDQIRFTDSLPKTRSGKIMRRVLKARAQGLPEGDLSTLDE